MVNIKTLLNLNYFALSSTLSIFISENMTNDCDVLTFLLDNILSDFSERFHVASNQSESLNVATWYQLVCPQTTP